MFKENMNDINKAVFEFKQYIKNNWADIWINNQ